MKNLPKGGNSSVRAGEAARQLIRRTRQVTRRKFPAEEKIRIVLGGIRGEVAVSELCRREGIPPTIYYIWLKGFHGGREGAVARGYEAGGNVRGSPSVTRQE